MTQAPTPGADDNDQTAVEAPAPAEESAPAEASAPPAAPKALSRTDARTRALELLFAADVRGVPVATVADGPDTGWIDDFTRLLIDTVVGHAEEIDGIIDERARGWSLDRMPGVDRNVLRIGLAELLHLDEVPPKVAIDEAVELAKQLSTDASPKFVNGILAAVARDRELL